MILVTKTSDQTRVCVCACVCVCVCVCVRVCVVIPSILNVGLVDAPAGVTQEEGHIGFLHLPSAVLFLIFLAIRIQPFFSLVNCEVELSIPTN